MVRVRPQVVALAAVAACLLASVGLLHSPAGTGVQPGNAIETAAFVVLATPSTPPSPARQVWSDMTLAQRIGQLFMVGTPATGASSAAVADIERRHVGNVMLTGRSYGGTRPPARVAAAMQARATPRATDDVRLLVATDREGGAVQVLQGAGFARIPSALTQGRWAPSDLRRHAGTWASQLAAAGVNMDLGPVEDTVPSAAAARDNPPIGVYDREFGYRTAVVAGHGRAVVRGLRSHGVVPTIKHFPGLGRVHANTDTSSGVTDTVTTRHDAYLQPFQTSIAAGAPVVMMSTAFYRRLDPTRPAAFSPFVIRTILRGDLGFRGVVISDDLGSARQVAAWRPGARAVAFIRAGGDLVLTVDPTTLPAMYDAVLARARRLPGFRAKVDASAMRILELKERRGLLQ